MYLSAEKNAAENLSVNNSMNNLTKDWLKYCLTVDSKSGPISLNWNDSETLAFYAALQSGLFGGASELFSKQVFFEQFPKWAQNQWSYHEQIVGHNIKPNDLILDIGSGIAVVDLLQAKANPTNKFILVDKQDQNFQQGVYYSDQYPFYNSWAPVEDCVFASGLDANRFSMQDPSMPWPEVDHIISYFSWCFHYPKNTYWSKVLSSLKTGGTLTLDVRLIDSEDVVGEISEELKFIPYKDAIPNTIPKHIDNYPSPDPKIMGYRCHWKRCSKV